MTTSLDLETADRLARQLFRLVRLVERSKSAPVAGQHGMHLDRAVFQLLVQLVDNGPQRTTALAEAVVSDPSTVSRQVGQLVGLELVERRADPVDGRACLLAATEQGIELLASARHRRNEKVAGLVSDWQGDDVERLISLLDRLNTQFEAHRTRTDPKAAL